MHRRHQHRVAVSGEGVGLEEGAGALDHRVGVTGEDALVEVLRQGQRRHLAEQDLERVERLDVAARHHQAQGQGRRHHQAHRTPDPAPENRRDHHRQRRQAGGVAVQEGLHQLRHDQLHHHEQAQGHDGERPARLDRRGEQRGAGGRDPHADIGHEAQQPRHRRPQQRLGMPQQHQAEPDDRADREVDCELVQEEMREALAGIVDGDGGGAQVAAAGEADETVAQGLLFEQHEDQHDDDDAGGGQRPPHRGEDAAEHLQRPRWRLMQLDLERPLRWRGLRGRVRVRRVVALLGHPVDHPPHRPGENAELAQGHLVQGRQLAAHGLLVLRQAGAHADQLRTDDRADRRQDQHHGQHGGPHRGGMSEAKTPQAVDQGRDQQAQHQGQGDRDQHLAAEVQQRQHRGGAENADHTGLYRPLLRLAGDREPGIGCCGHGATPKARAGFSLGDSRTRGLAGPAGEHWRIQAGRRSCSTLGSKRKAG